MCFTALTENASFKHVHTAIIHFNATEVHNLYKTPVLESQTTARSLMKAFTIAAAQARYLYGVRKVFIANILR